MVFKTLMKILVTGGAGFIGSHLTERLLLNDHEVVVADNCSNGFVKWVPNEANFIQGDLTNDSFVKCIVSPSFDAIFHLASLKDVNDEDPRDQFYNNTQMMYTITEAAITADIPDLLFTSSSTVYGESEPPTPESYAPLEPISSYGASKLAAEAICSQAAHTQGLDVYVVRFANIVGPRLRGAVIPDFIEKLINCPERLTILGNGRQQKSYLHIDDCIDAMLHVYEHAAGPMATYNLGSNSTTNVDKIAQIVAEQMDLDPDFEYTGGRRGWPGDVPEMRLCIDKINDLGWEPNIESDEAVTKAARELIRELTTE